MGYLHINNLYKDQDILLFKQCYALEKVHGSSANITFKNGVLTFFSGGESQTRFESLFDKEMLKEKLLELAASLRREEIIVYGEVYGGSCQKMSQTYGPNLMFIGFDVCVDGFWFDVPDADKFITNLGLEFVPYERIDANIEEIDKQRAKPSVVAQRRGMGNDKIKEGDVLRPLTEFKNKYDERVIVKHKNDKFNERATPQKIEDPNKLKILEGAEEVANEWCVYHRLEHVLQKIPGATEKDMKRVIDAMIEDIYREAKGEIVESKEVKAAINKKTVSLFKEHLKKTLNS